jgi:hypothetical protein
MRVAIVVLGSVSAGFWVNIALSPLANRFLLPGLVRSVADAEQAVAITPWLTGIPRFVAAGVAGLILGYVMDGRRPLVWICGLLVVMTVWLYGPDFLQRTDIGGGLGTGIAQVFVASLAAVACLALGRRLQGHEPVA